MPSEFDLIQTYFTWKQESPELQKSVGDDAAVVAVPKDQQLVITTDTLISGVHFPVETPPHAIGYKSLAVNLSDLAAMGADPAWFTLAMTLPEYDAHWLSDFSSGLKELAQVARILLIGGDTTRGALSISITAMGLAKLDQLMFRSSAKSGDAIYVTGTLGDAAAGLAMIQGGLNDDDNYYINRLDYPQPRNQESVLIRKYANACLDISDGFLVDLNHILQASNVGAVIDLERIPLQQELVERDYEWALNYALTGGDDYELLFTIPQGNKESFKRHLQSENIDCFEVGYIDQNIKGILSKDGKSLTIQGYNHFNQSF